MTDGFRAIEGLEIDLLLEGIFRRFGLDFRGYRREVLRAKLRGVMKQEGVRTVSGLQEKVMHDTQSGAALLRALGSHPAALFDNPQHYRAMREILVPCLRSSPAPRIWVAECVSAEEVCSLAILLAEEDLLERTQIYATSASEELLQAARDGHFPAERLAGYEERYRQSGGRRELRDYVDIRGGECSFVRSLCEDITWAQYNIATDASFNEFQLISCRGALNEFGAALRHRAFRLFHDSVPMFGLLSVDDGLGAGTAAFTRYYQAVGRCEGLYRRIA